MKPSALAATVAGELLQEVHHQLTTRAAAVRRDVDRWDDLDERLRLTGVAQGLELAGEAVRELLGSNALHELLAAIVARGEQ
jgi:DUF1365 family protein